MDVTTYLEELKNQLISEKNWTTMDSNYNWQRSAPVGAGVYAIRQTNTNTLIYVGETGSIKARMDDLKDSRRHSLRRSLGKKLFFERQDFVDATTSNKFPPEIENLLNAHITAELQVAWIEVPLGRKELEEFIVTSLAAETRMNRRGKRGRRI